MQFNRKKYRKAIRMISAVTAASALLLTLTLVCMRPSEGRESRGDVDQWEHATRLSNVLNAMDAEEGFMAAMEKRPFLEKMPYYLALASAAHLHDFDIPTVLLGAGLMNVLLLALGLAMFGRSVLPRGTPTGLILTVCLLFWGKGFSYSNEYHLSILATASAYPSTFCFGLSLIAMSWFLRLCRKQDKWTAGDFATLAAAGFLSAIVALTHSLTFLCFLAPTAIFIWLIFPTTGKRRLYLALLVPIFLLFALLYPWREMLWAPLLHYGRAEKTSESSTINAQSAPDKEESKTVAEKPKESKRFDPDAYEKHYNPRDVFKNAPAIAIGFIFLGLLLFRRQRRRSAWFLLLTAAFFLLGWAITGYAFGMTMGCRYLYFYGFIAQLAAVRAIWDYSPHRGKFIWISLAALLLVTPPARDCVKQTQKRYFHDETLGHIPADDLRAVKKIVGADKVLASDKVSFYMPAYRLKPAWRGRFGMYGYGEKRQAIGDWFADQTDATLLAAAHTGRTPARWLLIDKEDIEAVDDKPPIPPLFRADSKLLEQALETDRFILFKILDAPLR